MAQLGNQLNYPHQEEALHPHNDEMVIGETLNRIPEEEKNFLWHLKVLRGQHYPNSKIIPLLERPKKRDREMVKGRWTIISLEESAKLGAVNRVVTCSVKRRRSRPVGSSWAGKGACLQDFVRYK
ncbi:uncharacterized protein [Apostichopus japonicus]|uniref:uncharacterized protein isoform X1 n=1 Tax=Stichopus japonicus TaxID=307972 RepID=UPI003AB33245